MLYVFAADDDVLLEELGRVLDAERLLDRGVDRIEGVGKTRVAAHVLGLLEDDDVL